MIKLVLSLLVCLGAGSIGSFATMSSVRTWYPSLAKPDWTPPSSLFGPVWTFLYVLMGISLWIVWQSESGSARTQALWLFGTQLALNSAWSFLFFGLRSPLYGLVGVLLLDIAVLLTIWKIWQIKPLAGALLLPYMGWILFASALNFAIFRLNG